MSDAILAFLVLTFGLIVPGIVYGMVLYGHARYGRTAIASVSLAVALGLLVARRYPDRGMDTLTVVAIVLMLLMLVRAYPFRTSLLPERSHSKT